MVSKEGQQRSAERDLVGSLEDRRGLTTADYRRRLEGDDE